MNNHSIYFLINLFLKKRVSKLSSKISFQDGEVFERREGDTFFRKIFPIALVFLLVLLFATPSYSSQRHFSHWCLINLKGLQIDSDIFFVALMPREKIEIGITPKENVKSIRWSASGGTLTGESETIRVYTAPSKSGDYEIEVRAREGEERVYARIKVFVMVPRSKMENGYIEGYHMGEYPDPGNRQGSDFQPPDGFIRVTPENKDELVSENYELGDFVCPSGGGYPKFIVLDEALVFKLEIVTKEFRRLGLLKGKMAFLSAFRSPAYNGGRARFSRHMWGAAVDIYIDEDGRRGWMDDITRDGTVDIKDAILVYKVIEAIEKRGDFQGLKGGLGIYPAKPNHGPFVHMDVRHSQSSYRWATDESGNRIKNVSAWLQLPENYVRLPQGTSEVVYTPPPTPRTTSLTELRNNIRALEKKLDKLELEAVQVEDVFKPFRKEKIYLAVDLNNEVILLNRGRVILRRIKFKAGEAHRSCPSGLSDIYSVPAGALEIRRLGLDPSWFHPSWAFLGTKIPDSYSKSRSAFFSINTNGAIDLGAGAKIHAVNKKFSLALPGCLAVSEEDMTNMKSKLATGAQVFLFETASSSKSDSESQTKGELLSYYAFLKLRERTVTLNKNYVVIDFAKSRVFLKQNGKVVVNFPFKRVGPNFSRAYPKAEQNYFLPKGAMLVRSKIANPPWYKPDWMFEEQGKKIPPALGEGRVQTELLGKYGIYLGAGLVIHGVHDNRVPNRAIDYVAIELKEADLIKLWRHIAEGGVVFVE